MQGQFSLGARFPSYKKRFFYRILRFHCTQSSDTGDKRSDYLLRVSGQSRFSEKQEPPAATKCAHDGEEKLPLLKQDIRAGVG